MKAQEWVGSRELSSVVGAWMACALVVISLLGFFLLRPSDEIVLQDYQIASSSMAPGLLGPLLRAHCLTCRADYFIAADTAQLQLATRCLDCGGLCTVDQDVIPGEVTLVEHFSGAPQLLDPSSAANNTLLDTVLTKRFDRLVIRDGPDAGDFQVKRLWGLPGEQVEFRDGELWINGSLYQKNLGEFELLAVPVARYLSPNTSPNASPETSPYLVDKVDHHHQLKFDAPNRSWVLKPQEPYRWQYRRPARVTIADTPADQWLEPSELVDDYPCNQGISQSLSAVSDWLLAIRLSEPLEDRDGNGLAVEVRHLDNFVSIVAHAAQLLPETAGKPATSNSISIACRQLLIIALCDGRILLQTDVASREISLQDIDVAEGRSPFELKLTCLQTSPLTLQSLALLRDLHLTHAVSERHLPTLWQVPDDAVFVLGDNLPVSVDSRGRLGFITLRDLVGFIR